MKLFVITIKLTSMGAIDRVYFRKMETYYKKKMKMLLILSFMIIN